ncbi:Retrovirus-related Pol polyprotein from transposon 412 [Vitis vinifera]|uniref:Retrovirus-related Pol polyprotein from transposon 412 n=1 Tax=Vitis vinifera TaxID=29760 RepID=A0A438G2H9_VITVI|nr:Retrovirus-related Pol polyprotein from transposon 412 [Vitis vinifera]
MDPRAGAIPSSLHQKVKFIHDGQVVVVQSVGDMFIAAEPVLEISHTDDDLFLTGFTFDEHGSTVVLDIMRSMSYLPGMGLGRRQHGPSEFIAIPDHDVPFGLGSSPLRPIISTWRVCARRESLADYFVRASEPHAPSDGIVGGLSTTQEAELQRLVQQLRLRDGAPGPSTSVLIAPSSPDRTSLMTLCFPDEIDEHGTLAEIEETIQPGLASSFDLFGVLIIELAEESLTAPALESETQRLLISHADQPRELRIGSDLSDEREASSSCSDTWTFSHGPMRTCRALIHPSSSIVKEEIQKQLSVGFLSVVEYPEWLANVVPVPKKDGKYSRSLDVVLYGRIFRVQSDLDGSRGHGEDVLHYRVGSLAALERFFERIRQFRLRLNPKKCTFGVTSGKLLGYMVSERGIEVDPDKIRAILDMPAPRTEREVRGFLGRLQYISRFIARLTDICEPIFRLLRKSQPTVWDDQCQRAFERIESTCCRLQFWRRLHQAVLYSYTYQPALVGRLMRWLVLLTEFDIHYVTQKSIRGSIVADHLASLPVSDARAIDDDFPDEDVAAVTSLSGWRMYFDGAANHSGYGIGVLLISPHGDHIPRSPSSSGIRQMEVFGDSNLVLRQIQGEWKTRDAKLRPYHAYLELLVARFEDLRYTHLPRAQNQFADALATLASMIDIPADATVRPLLIESRSAPAYCCLIDDMEIDDGLPWYHDIYHFLRLGVYPEAATAKDRSIETVGHPIRDLWRDTI